MADNKNRLHLWNDKNMIPAGLRLQGNFWGLPEDVHVLEAAFVVDGVHYGFFLGQRRVICRDLVVLGDSLR
jgi:hypothetical protein